MPHIASMTNISCRSAAIERSASKTANESSRNAWQQTLLWRQHLHNAPTHLCCPQSDSNSLLTLLWETLACGAPACVIDYGQAPVPAHVPPLQPPQWPTPALHPAQGRLPQPLPRWSSVRIRRPSLPSVCPRCAVSASHSLSASRWQRSWNGKKGCCCDPGLGQWCHGLGQCLANWA